MTSPPSKRPPSAAALRLVFKGLVTPAACLLRLLGVDLLGVKARPQAKSYWKMRSKGVDMTSQG
jgi:hypothetical protein